MIIFLASTYIALIFSLVYLTLAQIQVMEKKEMIAELMVAKERINVLKVMIRRPSVAIKLCCVFIVNMCIIITQRNRLGRLNQLNHAFEPSTQSICLVHIALYPMVGEC